MTQPQIYQPQATEKIISFFGAADDVQSPCNGQWLIFPKAVVCLANVGEGPATSHFASGSSFYWVADQAYHINSEHSEPRWHFLPVPEQVFGSTGRERTIHLFASSQRLPKLLYVGELAPAYSAQGPRRQNHGMARLTLRPTLASAVWLRLGGLRLGNLDYTPLDQALETLQSPTTVEDRFGVLQQLVNFWHGPVKPEDGMSAAELTGVPLPMPLLWWYRLAGERTEIMSGQNMLFDPRERDCQLTDEGQLLFCVENGGVYQSRRPILRCAS